MLRAWDAIEPAKWNRPLFERYLGAGKAEGWGAFVRTCLGMPVVSSVLSRRTVTFTHPMFATPTRRWGSSATSIAGAFVDFTECFMAVFTSLVVRPHRLGASRPPLNGGEVVWEVGLGPSLRARTRAPPGET